MNKTMEKIVSISKKLAPLVELYQKLEDLYYLYYDDEDLQEIVEVIEAKKDSTSTRIRSLIIDLAGSSQLYMAITTPREESEEDMELKLKKLYRELEDLEKLRTTSYDSFLETEVSRLQDTIGVLEEELLNSDS